MRLINATTLKLVNFYDESSIPKYAILSHTWGSSEITFKELRNLNMSLKNARIKSKAKHGYYKITQCCAQALADGLDWCWVDTCCIDKTSSAELSEAINSMFRWYKNAAVCYAYLDDIDIFDPMRLGHIDYAGGDAKKFWTLSLSLISEKELSKARWFTRGWTLQELIAPLNVVFYIKGWNFVGNKESMKKGLSRITGIDEGSLDNGSLEAVSVARRMSWASKRVTTRVEDIAYCLLGIFDVNMPLLYGEGEKAYVRLQEEIMKDSEDQSLFAWGPLNTKGIWNPDLEAEVDDDGRSVFACHPRDFATSTSVSRLASIGDPYSVTSRGVRMDVNVIPGPGNYILLSLQCYSTGRLTGICIVVHRVKNGTIDQYVRHSKAGLIELPLESHQAGRMTTLYMRKKVPRKAKCTPTYATPQRTQDDQSSLADSSTLSKESMFDYS